MGYREDIRIIAETDAIKEELFKKSEGLEAAAKEAIGVVRTSVSQQGTAVPYSGTGNNAGGGLTPGYDVDGNPIDIPNAPAPTPAPNPSQVTTGGDSGSGGTTGGGGTGSSSGDKTGSTTSSDSAGGSRPDSKNQTNPDVALAADLAAIRAAMEAQGVPEDVIQQTLREYKQSLSEPGTHEVSDVYNGDAGYSPTYGDWSSLAPNSGEVVPTAGDIATLNALVGQDPDNSIVSVRVNIDGNEPKPTDAEAAAAGQGSWLDALTPPLKPGWEFYEAGYYWVSSFATINYTSAQPHGAGSQAAAAWAAEVALSGGSGAWNFLQYLYSGGNLSGFQIQINYVGNVWLTQFVPLSKVSCVVSPNIACDADPTVSSRETALPLAGLFMLTLKNGKYSRNPYDSEVPVKYNEPVSSVDLLSLITGDTYTIERGANGTHLLSNKTNPDYLVVFGADRSLKTVDSMSLYKFHKIKS